MNFESYEFIKMTSDDLYQYVKERSLPSKRMYLFFDELQRMAGWENTINAFRVDLDCDIYITGSNAYLLSSNIPPICPAAVWKSKCCRCRSQSLSISWFHYSRGQKRARRNEKQAVDADGTHYELREIFDAYMRYGGMPGIADVGLEQDKALTLLDGIYSTVIVRDILEREKRRGQRQITDAFCSKKLFCF